MITIEQYQNALLVLKEYKAQCLEHIKEIDYSDDFYETKIVDSTLSTRLQNALFTFFPYKYLAQIEDIASISKYEFTLLRNVGRKTKKELFDFCEKHNITMKA